MKFHQLVYFGLIVLSSLCITTGSVSAAILNVPQDYPTIQNAIDAAVDGDTVQIAPGHYSGTGFAELNFNGKAITVTSMDGPDTCVVYAPAKRWGVLFESNETSDSVITGITFSTIKGAAFYIKGSSPTIHNCKALYCDQGVYSDGLAGAGDDANPVITGTEFSFSRYEGAEFYFSSPVVRDCVILQNGDTGISIRNAYNTEFTHCLISGNGSGWNAGGFSASTGSGRLAYCTIAENIGGSGGGIVIACDGDYEMVNCIICDNIAEQGEQIFLDYARYEYHGSVYECGGTLTLSYCALPDGPNDVIIEMMCDLNLGEGMIRDNALLTFGPMGDYYLSHVDAGQYETSPCFDTGSTPADTACFDTTGGTICLNDRTTRTDAVTDSGTLDMGYHYPPATECDIFRARIFMPHRWYTPGRECFCDIHLNNPDLGTLYDAKLFVVLNIAGGYFFAPSMAAYDWYPVTIPPGEAVLHVLPAFLWPENAGTCSDAYWLTAILSSDLSMVYGDIDTFEFAWGL